MRDRGDIFGIFALILFLIGTAGPAPGQAAGPKPELLIEDLEWRSIGPANMGGRISDIAALDHDFRHVIAASASGGVWKSVNAGTTWVPIFDTYGSASIGAVAIFQKNPDIIWVGTGEANVRNSVGWGDGIYKSSDGGKTFTNLGLHESHHIAKIALHPENPDIAYAAAQGHLWGHTGQRGLFKTIDGGRTWSRLGGGLPDDGRTGCTHVLMDPSSPDTLYCAFWERLRRPWRFDSGGPNGGIFKTVDGGRTWRRLTRGLPDGDLGRIGLAVSRGNPRVVMAIIEHGFQPRPGSREYEDMSRLGTGIYRSEDAGASWSYINRFNNRPFYYSQIYINPKDDRRVYVMGTQAQVSEDGGRTLMAGMPGIAGDYHAMWLDPLHADSYYIGNDKGISLTHDHGEHFNFFDNFVISQIYQVSADNRDPYFVYVGLQDNGVWGGPSNSRDYTGIRNEHWFKFHSGDGFYTAPDPSDWTTVYSESQGGRIRRNHALFRQISKAITPDRRNTLNWKERIPEQKDPRYPVVRRNWNTPFFISPHNPHTLYYGANFLFKSVDRGESWRIISPDLSGGDPIKIDRESGGVTRDVTSAETHCTIVTLSESPLRPGLIWAGTDDGQLHLTRDDGQKWINLRDRLPDVPKGIWVSHVEASRFEPGACFVAFDGHRGDIFRPFVYRTGDFGETWVDIGDGLPERDCVYVIRQDPGNRDLLFAGTELACYVSVEGGGAWAPLHRGMPTVAVHDLLIHPSGDLIAGTHGRGAWILDDITPLSQLSAKVMESPVFLFENPVATLWHGVSRGATRGHQLFRGHNPLSMSRSEPSNSPVDIRNTATVNFYLSDNPDRKPEIVIKDLSGERSYRARIDAHAGVNRYRWNLRFDPSEAAQKAFLKRMERIFGDLRERAEESDQARIDELHRKFQKASSAEEGNSIRRTLMREFRSLATGFAFFGSDLRGPAAGPGAFRVILTVNGEERKGLIQVREDPHLKAAGGFFRPAETERE